MKKVACPLFYHYFPLTAAWDLLWVEAMARGCATGMVPVYEVDMAWDLAEVLAVGEEWPVVWAFTMDVAEAGA